MNTNLTPYLEIDIERTNQRDDSCNGIHQVLDRRGIAVDLGGSGRKTTGTLTLRKGLYAAHEAKHEEGETTIDDTLGLDSLVLGRIVIML